MTSQDQPNHYQKKTYTLYLRKFLCHEKAFIIEIARKLITLKIFLGKAAKIHSKGLMLKSRVPSMEIFLPLSHDFSPHKTTLNSSHTFAGVNVKFLVTSEH